MNTRLSTISSQSPGRPKIGLVTVGGGSGVASRGLTLYTRLMCACARAAAILSLSAGLAWAAPNTLESVSVVAGNDSSQVVKMTFREALGGAPVTFTTTNPNRLVLDFADTRNDAGRTAQAVGTGAIRTYQAMQSGERTRLVINLNGAPNYEVRHSNNTVYAVIKATVDESAVAPAAQAPAEPAKTGPEKGAPAKSGPMLRDVAFHRGEEGQARVVVTLSEPGVGVDVRKKDKDILVDFLSTQVPSALQRRLDVADFATPVQLIETYAHNGATQMTIKPKGRWDSYAYQTGDQFVLEVRAIEEEREGMRDKPVYSGEKLSLNFQNVDVRAVLQVIADFTGLNIIASDSVNGSVTLRLKDVPWDQALDIIMRARGLDKRTSGNVIWVAPRDELIAKEKKELEDSKDRQNLEPLVTRSYKLNYIRADEAIVVLAGGSRQGASSAENATCSPSSTGITASASSGSANTVATATASGSKDSAQSVNRVLSTRGGASHDLTTNTLIVKDTLDTHAQIETVLKEIDVPTRQVMIEARIVVADDTFSRDLGAKLGFHSAGGSNGINFGTSNTGANSRTLATGGAAGSQTGFNVQLPDSAGIANAGTLGFTILDSAANNMLSLELQALEVDNRGKIVSNPRVVTTNLRPAVILQGTQIPYQTTSTEGTQTSFKDAVLCLLVSPQILNNDSVILNVEVLKDAQGADTSAGPAINVKRVKTQVRVNNGETAILGGIFEQTLRDDTSKVPLLGDIPVIGNLFKSRSKSDDKSELLIFLTPRLLDDALTPGGVIR